jgi:predicted TPR repeat methyltransferase
MQKAAALLPDDAEAYYSLANILKGLGRLNEAANSYCQALQIKPSYAEAHNNMGNLLKELGRLNEAEESLRRALKIKPDFALAHCNLGNTLMEMGRMEEAEACCRRALQIKPDFAQAHSNLGNILSALGKLDAAVVHFKSCLDIDPEDSLGTRLFLARLGIEPMPARASEAQLNKLYAERSQNWDCGKTYHGHELVATALRKQEVIQKLDILDAGCGTGLVGMLVHDLANRLDGVDMSSTMLQKANEKGIYSQLDQGDMVSFMTNHPNSYDAILCAATLIHFGDLLHAFDAAATSLKDDGVFVFTLFPNDSELNSQDIAVAEDNGYANGGCYAHRSDYVRRVAEATGFAVDMIDTEIHEYDNKAMPIMGLIVVLRRRFRATRQASPLGVR